MAKKTTRPTGRTRPAAVLKLLPYADFPLSPHAASGRWYKVIRGKRHYFGAITDWRSALELYLEQRDDLHAGRKPRLVSTGVTVADVVNGFLADREAKLNTGDLKARTWADYFAVGQVVADSLGRRRVILDLHADDFAKLRADLSAKYCTATTMRNAMQRVRSMFKWAYDADLIERPIKYGPGFAPPTRKRERLERHAIGPRMFEAHELRDILRVSSPVLRAIVLLAVNAGMGNTDIAELPAGAADLRGGWLDYPRPKTGVPRRCPLWPATIEAIRESERHRPEAIDPTDRDLMFLTYKARRWVRYDFKPGTNPPLIRKVDPLSREFRKARDAAGYDRPGTGFYSLRRTFRTIADEVNDRPAVDRIMGHEDTGYMGDIYRQRIDDARLRAVVDHVGAWLKLDTDERGVAGKIG